MPKLNIASLTSERGKFLIANKGRFANFERIMPQNTYSNSNIAHMLLKGSPDKLLSRHEKQPSTFRPCFRLLLVALGDPDNKLSGLPE